MEADSRKYNLPEHITSAGNSHDGFALLDGHLGKTRIFARLPVFLLLSHVQSASEQLQLLSYTICRQNVTSVYIHVFLIQKLELQPFPFSELHSI